MDVVPKVPLVISTTSRCHTPMKVAPLDETGDDTLSMSTPSLENSSEKRHSLPAVASKFFFMDSSGHYIDTALKEHSVLPRFASKSLEDSYIYARLQSWKDDPTLLFRVGAVTLLAACSGVEAVLGLQRDDSPWTAIRMGASLLAIVASFAFLKKEKLLAGFLHTVLAVIAVLTVRFLC